MSIVENDLPIIYRSTVGFNDNQDLHRNVVNNNHPESPNRINMIRNVLEESHLIDQCQVLTNFPSIDEMDLRQTHDDSYLNTMIYEVAGMDQDELNVFCQKYDSVFMTPDSITAANSAVSCCRTMAEYIMEDKIPNGFAIVRPPGHHSDVFSACGFCIFNNTSQAAETAFNFGADRILIVDFDVHHGQGTQRIYYEDKRVLYFSIHRYENGLFWPHLQESNFDHIGKGEGRGYTVNVPLNEIGCNDADYISIFWNVLWPLAVEFNPDFVVVSAGFDACLGDPIGEMNLSPDGYSHMIYQLKALASGKLLMILEGGYNHSILSIGVHRCVRILCGHKPYPINLTERPKESTISSCLNVISMLRNSHVWSCFEYYFQPAGMKDVLLDKRLTSANFTPKTCGEEINTGDVEQTELLKLDWKSDVNPSLSKTVLIYNDSNLHFDSTDQNHPENPERIKVIIDKLNETNLLNKCIVIKNGRSASNVELEAVHDRPYIHRIRRTIMMSDEELRNEEISFDSIYLTRESFNIAATAVGAVLQCVDEVMKVSAGQINGFAIVRPPGHHAGLSKPSGFCIFNNVAAAAKYALDKYKIERILIMDWDVHHGNGTQEIFFEDNRVLYMSIHRHECGMFYPVGEAKDYTDVGKGKGEGYSVNIPWSYGRMGDEEYRAAFSKVVMPTAYEFNPELVFISAGFDAAKGDPLGEYQVKPETFALMTHHLSGLAGGRTIAVLEGGYNLGVIADCANAVCETLVNRSFSKQIRDEVRESPITKLKVCAEAYISLRQTTQIHAKYWSCLDGFQKYIANVSDLKYIGKKEKYTSKKVDTKSRTLDDKLGDVDLSSVIAKDNRLRKSQRNVANDKSVQELEKKTSQLNLIY